MGQIGHKWDKNGDFFSDQIQYILVDKARMYPIWGQSVPLWGQIWSPREEPSPLKIVISKYQTAAGETPGLTSSWAWLSCSSPANHRPSPRPCGAARPRRAHQESPLH